jgi:predicted lipid-binding transport protein (Tim44 family)
VSSVLDRIKTRARPSAKRRTMIGVLMILCWGAFTLLTPIPAVIGIALVLMWVGYLMLAVIDLRDPDFVASTPGQPAAAVKPMTSRQRATATKRATAGKRPARSK